MSFNLASCPTGWTEFTEAQGRYIVGLPADETLAAPVGTALTDSENRPVGRHTHTVNDPGHRHAVDIYAQSQVLIFPGDISSGQANPGYPKPFASTGIADLRTTGITIAEQGDVDGTNAPYIQLLVCQKT